MSHYGPGPAGETLHVGTLAQCPDPNCGVPPRTAAATAARMRNRQDRMAAELRGLGWGVITPETMADGFALVPGRSDRARVELEYTIMGVR